MFFCLRIDLDYVPWDTPDAGEFGHGEPAMLLRLLDFARLTGYKFHFFVSERVLRAFPAAAEAVLNDGHDLDWLCKHPEDAADRYQEIKLLFATHGHTALGMAIKGAWPDGATFEGIEELKFLSGSPGFQPSGLKLFAVESRGTREAVRSGLTARAWTDATKSYIRQQASRNLEVTVAVRPQVLSKLDPKLVFTREILEIARAVEMPIRTLREQLSIGI